MPNVKAFRAFGQYDTHASFGCLQECNTCLFESGSVHLSFITGVTVRGCSGSLFHYPYTSVFYQLIAGQTTGDRVIWMPDGLIRKEGMVAKLGMPSMRENCVENLFIKHLFIQKGNSEWSQRYKRHRVHIYPY